MNVFYVSDIPWFDSFANGMIWFLIVAAVAFVVWVGYDMITGPRKQRAELERLLKGLDTSTAEINTHKDNGAAKLKTRPFGPGSRKAKDQVKADLTANS